MDASPVAKPEEEAQQSEDSRSDIAIAMRRIIESSGWLMSHSICDGDVEFPNMAKLPQLWTTLHTFVDPSRAAARGISAPRGFNKWHDLCSTPGKTR